MFHLNATQVKSVVSTQSCLQSSLLWTCAHRDTKPDTDTPRDKGSKLTQIQTQSESKDTGIESDKSNERKAYVRFQNSTCFTSGPGLCPTNLAVIVERGKRQQRVNEHFFPLYIYGPWLWKRILVHENLVFRSVGQVYLFNYFNRVDMAIISNSKTTRLPLPGNLGLFTRSTWSVTPDQRCGGTLSSSFRSLSDIRKL